MAAELDRLVKKNLDLLESGNFSDAEIICNGATWKVHKLILRSRCAWFDKAFTNGWKEAQTGQIHLDGEEPEQVYELLKFIHSGRYVPALAPTAQCVSVPVLEKEVSLWRAADYFLLEDLKAELHEYLLERLAATLHLLHGFRLPRNETIPVHTMETDGRSINLATFIADFSKAVTKIYHGPAARELHKLFAVFACGLREHLPARAMWDLMSGIPAFRQDVSTALILLHFPNSTNGFVAGGLGELCFEAKSARPVRSKTECVPVKCTDCGNRNPTGASREPPGGDQWEITCDPFSLGIRKWCHGCALEVFKFLLEDISGWAADAPDPA